MDNVYRTEEKIIEDKIIKIFGINIIANLE